MFNVSGFKFLWASPVSWFYVSSLTSLRAAPFYGCADLDAMNCACTGKLRHGAIVQYKENQFVAV